MILSYHGFSLFLPILIAWVIVVGTLKYLSIIDEVFEISWVFLFEGSVSSHSGKYNIAVNHACGPHDQTQHSGLCIR